DGQLTIVQKLESGNEERTQNPVHIILGLDEFSRSLPDPITASAMNVDGPAPKTRTNVDARLALLTQPVEYSWPFRLVVTFLRSTYFFNPFRHSVSRLGVKQTENLSPDGENLAQVLHTLA